MQMKRFATATAALLLSSVAAFGQASSTWSIDSAHSNASFEIKHLSVSTVRGSIHKITGNVIWDDKNPSASSVDATLDANTINTGEDKRDAHLKSPDFFDVTKYPTLHFVSTQITKVGGKYKVVGNLTLGGQTKPVTLDVDGPVPPQKGQRGGLVSGFSATTTISRKDFNFGQKYTEPALGDAVKIVLDLEIDQK
jgi:polyisoprenoid-binding protein YceI